MIAHDCCAARAELAGGHFDIVLLDYQLPDGNGLALLHEIKSSTGSPSVIMVTGQGDEEIAAEAVRLRASGYVVKDHRLPTMLPEAFGSALLEISRKHAQEELKRARDELEDRVREWTRELEEAIEFLKEEIAERKRDENGDPQVILELDRDVTGPDDTGS